MTDIERLFKANYAQMHRVAVMLLHDDELARDVVHDVFASLLDGTSLSPLTPGYLLKAVRNRCLNHIRDLDIHQRVQQLYFADVEEYDVEEWPDEQAVALIGSIVKAELPEQCRRVVELRFVDGMKFEAVAREMGISQTAVFKHLRHALAIIRKRLDENG